MLIGTGWLMISLKNFSPSSILLSHSIGWSGLRSFHGGRAPSRYLPAIERDADIEPWRMDEILALHCIAPGAPAH